MLHEFYLNSLKSCCNCVKLFCATNEIFSNGTAWKDCFAFAKGKAREKRFFFSRGTLNCGICGSKWFDESPAPLIGDSDLQTRFRSRKSFSIKATVVSGSKVPSRLCLLQSRIKKCVFPRA